MRKANGGRAAARVTNTSDVTARRDAGPGSRRSSTTKRSSTKAAKPTATRRRTTSRAPKKVAAPSRSRAITAPATPSTKKSVRPPPRPAVHASPEDLLLRAMTATTPRARALWARRGLASRRRLDATTQSMLLRQLYLAHYETRRFDKALVIARQALELDVLPDVVHQDAARAAQALGDIDVAAGHLRLAARVGPAKRRAFHWWTLGSLYYLAGRHADAISALTRAARWGTRDKPLYQGHLALARCAHGERVDDVSGLLERLAAVPAGQGYGRFVLGQLAYHGHRWDEARRHLESFVKRSTEGRAAVAIALDGEIALARKTLETLPQEG